MMSHVNDPNLPPAYAQPPRKGWFGRNWLWFIPTVVLLPICLCGGLCVGVPYFAMRGLAESGAYKIALETVQQSAEAKEALGEPIEGKLIPFGAVVEAGGGAKEATIGFQVQGPKGSGIVASKSRKDAGTEQWVLTELIVSPTNGGQPITIVSSGTDETLGLDTESTGEEAEMPAKDRPTEESETESPEMEEPAAEEPAAEEPAAEEPAEEKPASEEKPA